MSHILDYEKERRFENYGKKEAPISVDGFLADLCPRAKIYDKDLKAYNQLLEHMRDAWK